MKKTRGRPRSYDPDAAMEAALELFWKQGYSATSLDDLSTATGMNRPSLYAAFGDKQALYVAALQRFAAVAYARFSTALAHRGGRDDIRAAVRRFFAEAIRLYTEGGALGLAGCMVLSTAPVAAGCEPARQLAAEIVRSSDTELLKVLRAARARGELRSGTQLRGLALALLSILHSLSLRARCGQPPRALQALARAGVALIDRERPSPRQKEA